MSPPIIEIFIRVILQIQYRRVALTGICNFYLKREWKFTHLLKRIVKSLIANSSHTFFRREIRVFLVFFKFNALQTAILYKISLFVTCGKFQWCFPPYMWRLSRSWNGVRYFVEDVSSRAIPTCGNLSKSCSREFGRIFITANVQKERAEDAKFYLTQNTLLKRKFSFFFFNAVNFQKKTWKLDKISNWSFLIEKNLFHNQFFIDFFHKFLINFQEIYWILFGKSIEKSRLIDF